MKLFFSILLFTLNSLFAQEKYELSICAIFQNEAKYLHEWIEFHISQGVNHFYLFDNLSTDHPEKILKNYVKEGVVTFEKWPYDYTTQEEWNEIQCECYFECVKKHVKDTKWIAFLDTDEFLFCPNKKKLRHILKKYSEYGSISAYWMMYGTSNINVPKGEKITEYLTYRAKDDFPGNKIMKTIARTKYIQDIVNPHFVVLYQEKSNFQCAHEELRINHYWSRDLDFFFNVKLPRRERWYSDKETQIIMEMQMNEVYDPILRFF